MKKLRISPWSFSRYFIGFCAINSHSQDKKGQRRRNTSWKKILMKVLLHPPQKNIIQPSILCNSLLFLWKTLGKPFWGLNTLPKRRLVPELLGFLEESPFVVDESSKGKSFRICSGDFFRMGKVCTLILQGTPPSSKGDDFFRRSSCRRFFRFVWETKSGVFGWEIRRIWISKVRSWWNSKKVDWKKKEKTPV